jgi:hypothetical protein
LYSLPAQQNGMGVSPGVRVVMDDAKIRTEGEVGAMTGPSRVVTTILSSLQTMDALIAKGVAERSSGSK